jgi:hypothetical protein
MIKLVVACRHDRRRQLCPLVPIARVALAYVLSALLFVSTTSAQILRVVTYNVAEDVGGSGVPGTDLGTVLQAIGNHSLAGHAQPIDVLALEELYETPATTLSAICTQLNGIYGAGTYAYDTTVDPTTDPTLSGNGPSGLIFNTKTVQKLSTAIIGSASSSGAPRAPMRYTLAPKGYNDHSADFTIYVSHMKSGSAGSELSGSNGYRRNVEAQAIRDDAYTLNDGLNGTTSNEVAHIIYSGDYNWGAASENAYQTMISSSVHSGIMKAYDTLNPSNNWTTSGSSSSPYQGLFTESATYVQYRDDVQLVSGPMTNQAGMQLVPNTLGAFGNGGNIFHESVTSSDNSGALTDLTPSSYRTSVLNALTTATDHLPVVADYSFATAVGAPGDYDHSGAVNSADYTLWRSTLGSATNLAADGNHNGVIDAGDYLIWRRFRTGGSGAELGPGGQVPEPAAWMLALGGCLACLSRSRLRG